MMLRLLKFCAVSAAICLSAAPLLAQHDHKFDLAHDARKQIRPAGTVYRVQADIRTQEAAIYGFMDIICKNTLSRPIEHLNLKLPEGSYQRGETLDFHTESYQARYASLKPATSSRVWVDSILFQGARLEHKPVMIDATTLLLTLPFPLRPDQVAPLIVSFKTDLPDLPRTISDPNQWTVVTDWVPGLLPLAIGDPTIEGLDDVVDDLEPAQFDVQFRVDSAYNLIAPGMLFNDKEHYGTLPVSHGDTVFTDVLARMVAFRPNQVYVPVFESGFKQYAFRLHNGNNFPFVIAGKIMLDRAFTDGLVVESYYPPDLKEKYQGRVAGAARDIVAAMEARLGMFPYQKLMIVSDRDATHPGLRELVMISPENAPDDLNITLALPVAQCWSADFIPGAETEEGRAFQAAFDEGLAAYIAAQSLHDLFGPEACATYGTDRLDESQLCVADRLHMLRFLVGDSLFWETVKSHSYRYRYDLPTADAFENLLAENSGKDLSWFFDQWSRPDIRADLYLSNIKTLKENSFVTASGTAAFLNPPYMTTLVAFVMESNDTIFDTLSYEDFTTGSGTVTFEQTLPAAPVSIIADPYHLISDFRRNNNYWSRHNRRFIYHEPRTAFPCMKE